MTITLPLRLMILHFSHMGFTEGLTFIGFLLSRIAAAAKKLPCNDKWGYYLLRQVMRPRVRS